MIYIPSHLPTVRSSVVLSIIASGNCHMIPSKVFGVQYNVFADGWINSSQGKALNSLSLVNYFMCKTYFPF